VGQAFQRPTRGAAAGAYDLSADVAVVRPVVEPGPTESIRAAWGFTLENQIFLRPEAVGVALHKGFGVQYGFRDFPFPLGWLIVVLVHCASEWN